MVIPDVMPVLLPPRRLTAQVLFLLLLLGEGPLGHAQPAADSSRADTLHLSGHLEAALDAFGETDQMTIQAAEQFAQLKNNPLNVNQASAADLSSLPGLSVNEAHRIVAHRNEEGAYETWAAVRTVENLRAETVQGVRPFLTLGTNSGERFFPSVNTIVSNLDFTLIQRFSRRLELGRGYRTGRFLGSPGRLTTRLRLDHERRLQLALTLDKDPGEPLRWSPSTNTYGFDHIAGSLALRDLGPIETLILGDFSAQFGQGVAMWQGLRFGKGRDPVSPAQQTGRGVLPYRSASEANFFRGAAATVALPTGLSLSAFASRRHRDATLDSSLTTTSSSTPTPVRTLSGGGQHRTPSELARKGTFGEMTVGGALEHRSSALHVGITGYHSRFNRPLRPEDQPYRQFRGSGRQTSVTSAYGTAYVEDYTLFGEVARTPNGTYGGLLGAALDEAPAQAILLGRRYPREFAPFYGNGFGDGGRTQNEIGVYTGLRLRIAEKWAIGAYVDQFRAPWLRFNVPRPSTGWETRGVLEHDPRPWLSTYVQVRAQGQDEGTQYNGPGNRTLDGVQKAYRYSARWHTEYSFSDALTVRTRLELSRHTTSSTTAEGFFLSQGFRWSPHSTLQMDTRLAFFDTDGFAARIYAYEHDLLYSFSAPVFFDRGRRSYLLVRYDPLSSLTIEAKYGITSYENRSSIGSGLNQIEGNRRREVRFQIRWTL